MPFKTNKQHKNRIAWFLDLIDNLHQADQKDWQLDQQAVVSLCDSLNSFFFKTGCMPKQSYSLSAGSRTLQHSSQGENYKSFIILAVLYLSL